LQLGIIEQLTAVFNMLLSNTGTGLHAASTARFCHQVVLDSGYETNLNLTVLV